MLIYLFLARKLCL